jgi:hypothetical protein
MGQISLGASLCLKPHRADIAGDLKNRNIYIPPLSRKCTAKGGDAMLTWTCTFSNNLSSKRMDCFSNHRFPRFALGKRALHLREFWGEVAGFSQCVTINGAWRMHGRNHASNTVQILTPVPLNRMRCSIPVSMA